MCAGQARAPQSSNSRQAEGEGAGGASNLGVLGWEGVGWLAGMRAGERARAWPGRLAWGWTGERNGLGTGKGAGELQAARRVSERLLRGSKGPDSALVASPSRLQAMWCSKHLLVCLCPLALSLFLSLPCPHHLPTSKRSTVGTLCCSIIWYDATRGADWAAMTGILYFPGRGQCPSAARTCDLWGSRLQGEEQSPAFVGWAGWLARGSSDRRYRTVAGAPGKAISDKARSSDLLASPSHPIPLSSAAFPPASPQTLDFERSSAVVLRRHVFASTKPGRRKRPRHPLHTIKCVWPPWTCFKSSHRPSPSPLAGGRRQEAGARRQ